MNPKLLQAAEAALTACRNARLSVAAVESCTGGLLASALTALPGSSDVMERGFVTYSNRAKIELVSVPAAVIEAQGAVSEPVARAMAAGGLARSGADVAVAVTGIAGPDGGTAEKPVGLVHLAAARRGGPTIHTRRVFAGDRAAIREASVLQALRMIVDVSGRPGR